MRPLTTLLLALMMAASAAGQCWGVSARPAVAGSRWLPALAPMVPLPVVHPAPVIVPAEEPARVAVPARPSPPKPKRPAPPRLIGGRKCDCDACPLKGCPDGCACAAGKDAPDAMPTGVDRSRISDTPRYTIGGREVTRSEAVRSIGQLVDDSGKARLTLFGSDARKALRTALLADAALAPAVLAQDYPADHWAVARHPKLGEVSVYLQRADGTTLWRGSGSDAAAVLKAIKQALGLIPPDAPAPVGPDGKPTPPAPVQPAPFDPSKIPLPYWIGGAVLLLILTQRRN